MRTIVFPPGGKPGQILVNDSASEYGCRWADPEDVIDGAVMPGMTIPPGANLEAFNFQPGDFVRISCKEEYFHEMRESLTDLAMMIGNKFGCFCVVCHDSMAFDKISEEEMARAGWIRRDQEPIIVTHD